MKKKLLVMVIAAVMALALLPVTVFAEGGTFTDVTDQTAYWYKPVNWAAEKGIAKGFSNGSFGAEESCTRREIMIFIWRQMGCEKGTVKPEEYFEDWDLAKYPETSDTYKAVSWGITKEITKGFARKDGEKTVYDFRADSEVTRKDAIIMIYRAAGKPAWTAARGEMKFTDVVGIYGADTDTYNAICWAYNNRITNGYSSEPYKGQFGCAMPCLRKDIATFLYRMNAVMLITVTEHPAQDLTYNGQSQKLGKVTADVEGCTISYKVDGGEYSADEPAATDAGTHTVGYKVEKSGYNAVEGTFDVTIAKAANNMSFDLTTTSAESVYSEADDATKEIQAATGSPMSTGDTVSYTVTSKTAGGRFDVTIDSVTGTPSVVCKAGTPAGTYDLVIQATSGGKNYEPKTVPDTTETANFVWTVGSGSPEFYAVINTEAEGEKPAYSLSFYYDTNKAAHAAVSTKTVFDNLPTEAAKIKDWGYHQTDSTGIPYSTYVKNVVIDKSMEDYHELKSTAYMFYGLIIPTKPDLSYLANADNISGCEYLDVSNVTDMQYMFNSYAANSQSITAVPDVSGWNTSNVTDMSSMFGSYGKMTPNTLDPLDLHNWNICGVHVEYTDWQTGTTKLTGTEGMFAYYNYTCKANKGEPAVVYGSMWNTTRTDLNAVNMFDGANLKGTGITWSSANTSENGRFTAFTE